MSLRARKSSIPKSFLLMENESLIKSKKKRYIGFSLIIFYIFLNLIYKFLIKISIHDLLHLKNTEYYITLFLKGT